jgi:hypothetical protein
MAELQKSWARGAECAREPKVQPFIYDREEKPKVGIRGRRRVAPAAWRPIAGGHGRRTSLPGSELPLTLVSSARHSGLTLGQQYPPEPELQVCATRLGERTREWGAFIARGFRPEWRGGTNYTRLCVQRREITRLPPTGAARLREGNGMTAAAASHSRRSFPDNGHAAAPPLPRRSRRRRIDRSGRRRFEMEAAI